MTGKGLLFVLLFVHLFSSLSAEEPFRTFTTASGSSLELKLIGYEGQTFFLVDKKGQRYGPKFKDFSKTDQFYLIEASKRVPKGKPAPLVSSSKPEMSSEERGRFSFANHAYPAATLQ